MIYTREIQESILKALVPNKVIVLLGARQIGKTILLGQITEELNEEYLKSDTIEMAVQVNGKVRANIEFPADKKTDKEFVLGLAKQQKNIERYLDGTTIVKEIFVPGRIVNLVVK
jgi:leucyl-tRNA synthetase